DITSQQILARGRSEWTKAAVRPLAAGQKQKRTVPVVATSNAEQIRNDASQHPRRFQIRAQCSFEGLEQLVDAPRAVADEYPLRRDVRVARDAVAHRAEGLAADVLRLVAR